MCKAASQWQQRANGHMWDSESQSDAVGPWRGPGPKSNRLIQVRLAAERAQHADEKIVSLSKTVTVKVTDMKWA